MTSKMPSDEEVRARIKAFAEAGTVTMAQANENMRRLIDSMNSAAESFRKLGATPLGKSRA